MKTLNKIREEYNNAYGIQEAPEKLMLESKSVPSPSQMPSILVFRRMTYKLYPGKQVVALYYSKMLDKYLTIPFGPTGNLNLSEAEIFDNLPEEIEEKHTLPELQEHFANKLYEVRMRQDEGIVGDTLEKARKYVTGTKAFKAAQEIGHNLPGYEDVKDAKQHFAKGEYKDAAKSAVHSVGKALATGAGVAAKVGAGALAARSGLLGAGASAVKDALTGGGQTQQSQPEKTSVDLIRDKPQVKSSSSWKNKPTTNPVDDVRMKRQMLAPVKENKMTDIRKMVNEGIESKDLHINGRQVTLNTGMAKRILEVYDSVNTKNKKIVEGMLNEDLESFKKLLNFSIRK